jgi:phage terminase large subunit GpA-like protein
MATIDPDALDLLPPQARSAIAAAVERGLQPLRADPPERLADWAAGNFILTADSSHKTGAWESWPFQIGILDAFSNDDIRHVDVQKSKRVGYTKMITAFIGWSLAHRKRKVAVWQPTDDDRDSFVKTEIDPILQIPAIAACRVGNEREETLKYKRFLGAVLHLLGGKAARAYRRITVDTAVLDEWSQFDQTIEKAGPPGVLAEGRLEGAPYPKFVGGSTPRIKNLCHVEASRLAADADLRYHITCRHCGVDHPLLWAGRRDAAFGLHWTKGDPQTVRHVCPHCHAGITQAEYLARWDGEWVCERTGIRYTADRRWLDAAGKPCRPPPHVAFRIWAAYSPQRTWVDIATEHDRAESKQAQGDDNAMAAWYNETAGLTWEAAGERSDEHALQARSEPFPLGIVPKGALILFSGVDVQADRWEISVWGFGRNMESWTVDHHIIYGNTMAEDDWQLLTQYLQRTYPQAWGRGRSLRLSGITIDSNYATQAVYNWVRAARAMGIPVQAGRGEGQECKAIKGPAKAMDINWRGQTYPGGVKLWHIGVDTAKDLLHGQLKIAVPGPGYIHFSHELPREWFEQLTAEQLITVRTPRGDQQRWVKRRPRNEVLDCRNLAVHAAYVYDLNRWAPAHWDRLEAMVQPAMADLFDPVAPILVEGSSQDGAGADPGDLNGSPPVPYPPSPPPKPEAAAPLPTAQPRPQLARQW